MRDFLKKRKLILCYTVEFLLLAAVLWYSFGNFSLIKGDDGMNQFFPTFVYCGRYIREVLKGILQGQFNFPQFDFSIGMGEGIIPTLNYYGFGDPFMIFSAVTPVKYATYAYTAVMILKMYISGFGFIYYCKKRNMTDYAILTGLPFYIVNNYVFYFCFQYPPYQSVMITLPFLCAGLDDLIRQKEGKKKISIVLILSVAFQALYGFYLLYMELLFAAVYALVSLLCATRSFKILIKKIGVLFLHIAAGLAMGGMMFIPAIIGYFNSSRGGDFYWRGWKVMLRQGIEKYWEAFSAIVVPEGFSANGILIPLLAVIAIAFAFKKISGYKEIKILLLIFLVAYIETRLTSFIACGFSTDVWHNRWIFSLTFLAAVLTSAGAQSLFGMTKKGWLICGGISVLYYGLLSVFEYWWRGEALNSQRSIAYFMYGVLAVIIMLVLIVGEKRNVFWKKWLIPACIVVSVGLNIYTVFESGYGFGAKWNFKEYGSVRNELLASNAQLYNTEEEAFARMDIEGNSDNEALYTKHYGVQEYFSMINGNIYDFYSNFMITKGLSSERHHLEGLDSRSGIEDLLAVAYYDDVKKNVITENTNHLPIGFTFNTYMLESEANEVSAITKNARILDTVILDKAVEGIEKAAMVDESTLWTEEECKVEFVNIETNGEKIKVNNDSKIIVTIDSSTGGETYIYAEQLKIGVAADRDNYIYFGDSKCRFLSGTSLSMVEEQPGLFCVGMVEKGKNVFEISFSGTAEYTLGKIHVYTVFADKLEEFNAERQKGSLQNITVENDTVTGTIETAQKEILFLGIPYNTGWKAYVNGEETKILKADYGFSALVLEEGENNIYLKYTTPGLTTGIMCTIGAVVVLVCYGFVKKRERYGDKNEH